jgi:hypothetical protein
MLLLLVYRPSSTLGLEDPGNAIETPAPEPEKESDVIALSALSATTMLVESLVPPEPSEPVIVEARGANIGAEPPVGERTEAKEESPDIPTGKLM